MFEGKWLSKDSAVGARTLSAQLGLTIDPYFGTYHQSILWDLPLIHSFVETEVPLK